MYGQPVIQKYDSKCFLLVYASLSGRMLNIYGTLEIRNHSISVSSMLILHSFPYYHIMHLLSVITQNVENLLFDNKKRLSTITINENMYLLRI